MIKKIKTPFEIIKEDIKEMGKKAYIIMVIFLSFEFVFGLYVILHLLGVCGE